jgi:hypothetical protein
VACEQGARQISTLSEDRWLIEKAQALPESCTPKSRRKPAAGVSAVFGSALRLERKKDETRSRKNPAARRQHTLMNTRGNYMKHLIAKVAATFPLLLCLSGLAAAEPTNRCTNEILKGQYVFTASGFTRPPNSVPGTPWVPKAIIEVLQFNGDGTLSTPALTVANPFGDLGNILQPPAGAPGEYSINDDCSGTVRFFDAANVTFKIYVDLPMGNTIWMIQINPTNNVFQGSAKRVL